MAEQISIKVHYRECPGCTITMRSPDTVVASITYPDDLAEIDQLLRGNLNTVQHGCGKRIAFGEHLTLVHPTRGELASTLDGYQLLAAEDLAEFEVTRVGSYAELMNVLYGWLWFDTGRVLSPGPETAELFTLSPSEFLNAVGPIALLAMKIHRDGLLPISFAPNMTTPPDRANEVIRELGVELTARAVRQVVELVVHDGRAEEIFDEFADRIPPACLDDAVLQSLSRTTRTVLEDEGAHPMVKWRTAVANAAAYASAGRRCPEADGLAAFLFALWNLGRREDVELDPRVWVTPEVMQRLVQPESVLDLMREVIDAGPDTLKPALESFAGFASALGHDDAVATAFTQVLARIPDPTDSKVDAIIDAILTIDAPDLAQHPEADEWERGFVLAGAVWGVISGLPEHLAVRGHDRARASLAGGSVLQTYAFDCATCQRANQSQRSALAARCAHALLGHWGDESIGPKHALFGVNEAANALRLAASYEKALELYAVAESLAEFVEEDNRRTIRLNKAIVLRDMGDFVAARDELVELVESDPDDFAALESLAVLHVRAREFPASFSLIDRTLTRPGLPPEVRRRFVRLKGLCCAFSGDASGAVHNLSGELRREPRGSPLRLSSLAALQWVDSDDAEIREVLERAAQEIVDTAVGASASGRSPALLATASLALRRVRAGNRPAAMQAFELCRLLLGQEDNWPWQVELVYAWLCVPEDHEEAAAATRRAVAALDRKVPTAKQAEFAMTWIGDQDVALLQSIATQLAISDPADRVLVDDVLAAFDLQNGRELTSLAARSRRLPELDELDAEVAAFQAEQGTDIVAVLDSAEGCSLLMLPLDGRPVVVPLASAADVRAAVVPLSYPVNPLAPESSDAITRPWWKLASTFADAVRMQLPANRPLVILDGSRLVSTPLHAAGWPGTPLIFERPVSYAVNIRLLVSDAPAPLGGGRAALVCPKQGDRPDFVDRLESTGRTLRDNGYCVTSGAEVDEDALIAALGTAREVILLCHGVASASAVEGPGICVAAHGTLPPSALMVEQDPALHAFVVTWRDLMSLESTPETVVSLACSSGRTRSGRGGTRIGLDQALVGRSTSHLVSPVWNVAQASALAWLDALVRARTGQSMRDAYRAAVVEVARNYPHPYHWAPFTLRSHYLRATVRGGIDGPAA